MHSVQMVRPILGTTVSWLGTMGVWRTGQPTKLIYPWAILKKKKFHISLRLQMLFTICDAYHCSMHTGTDANRSYHLTGTNGVTPTKRSFVKQ